tara:strand:+ start:3702 stop:3845 length:144 start_codon:yes stop_codon:yes gene_type:complete
MMKVQGSQFYQALPPIAGGDKEWKEGRPEAQTSLYEFFPLQSVRVVV